MWNCTGVASTASYSEQLVKLQDVVEHVGQRVHGLSGRALGGLHRREHAGEGEAGVHRAVRDVQLADGGVVRSHDTIHLNGARSSEWCEHAVLGSVLVDAENAGTEAVGQKKLIALREELGGQSNAL